MNTAVSVTHPLTASKCGNSLPHSSTTASKCGNSLPHSDLLSSVVYHLLHNVINSSQHMWQFVAESGLDTSTLSNMVLRKMTDTSKTFSVKDCCDVLFGIYDDNFNEFKCMVYHSGKSRYQLDCNYQKHCGNKLTGSNAVCVACMETSEGKKVQDQIKRGVFDPTLYHNKKTKLRQSYAKNKLRAHGIEHFFVSKKLFVKSDLLRIDGVYYSCELNVYVTQRQVGDTLKTITLGEMSPTGQIKKISYNTLVGLKKVDVTVDIDTLSKKCLKHLELSCVFTD